MDRSIITPSSLRPTTPSGISITQSLSSPRLFTKSHISKPNHTSQSKLSIIKMHFSIILPTILASLVACAPAPTPAENSDLSGFEILEIGVYNSTDATFDASGIPPECTFEGKRSDFTYAQIKQHGESGCIGWEASYSDCGKGAWPDREYNDMIATAREQVKKDGWKKSSNAGRWMATWFIGTTAVPNRDGYAGLFEFGVRNVKDLKHSKYKEIFFSNRKNFMTVSTSKC